MSVVIVNCDQGTPEWLAARAGIPTASEFQCLLAKGRGGGESKGRATYMRTLAGQILTGEVVESYTNPHMERGKIMEAEARDWYAFQTDHELTQVGFIRNDAFHAGVSPDSLVRNDGMLEIKTKLPHLQIEVLIDGVLPNEHKAQCQGAMWVAGRQWLDFVSYWPKLPPFRIRVERDEPYIAALAVAVREFNEELAALVKRFQS